MGKWETMDTAPKDGEHILLWRSDWPCPIVSYWNDSYDEHFWNAAEEVLSDIIGQVEDPTHWLRYPTPPSF